MNEPIHISVETKYIGKKQQSRESEVFVFSYTVSMTNKSDAPLTLRNRHWVITNGDGEIAEVSGAGVVGEQPTIEPEQTFKYTSASMLKTEVGSMHGHYEFEHQDLSMCIVKIPVFRLAVPNSLH